jgi:hypothetical protein
MIEQIEHLENAIERSAAAERDALLEASVHSWCGENWCPVQAPPQRVSTSKILHILLHS